MRSKGPISQNHIVSGAISHEPFERAPASRMTSSTRITTTTCGPSRGRFVYGGVRCEI